MLTRQVQLKWLLGENDNSNCVREFKFTSARELLLLNALLEDVVAALVSLLPVL